MVWEFDFTEWNTESDRLIARINGVGDYHMRYDLRKMHSNLDRLAISIAREEIACRYRSKQTDRHAKMTAEFEEMEQNLKEHITWALLM